MLRSPIAGSVDELILVDDWCRPHALDLCSKFLEQIRLLLCLVVRHTYMRQVASCSAYRSKRDARTTDGTLVDGVARMRSQETIVFGLDERQIWRTTFRHMILATMLIMLNATRSFGLLPAPFKN